MSMNSLNKNTRHVVLKMEFGIINGNHWQLTDYETKKSIAGDSLKHCKQITEMIMQGKYREVGEMHSE